jgi:hypothetical protein
MGAICPLCTAKTVSCTADSTLLYCSNALLVLHTCPSCTASMPFALYCHQGGISHLVTHSTGVHLHSACIWLLLWCGGIHACRLRVAAATGGTWGVVHLQRQQQGAKGAVNKLGAQQVLSDKQSLPSQRSAGSSGIVRVVIPLLSATLR